MIKSKLKESANQHQKELDHINEKLSERDIRVKESQDQISELKIEKQTLSEKKEQIELLMEELSQKNDDTQKLIGEQKHQIEQQQVELDEEKAKKIETQIVKTQIARANSKANWLEKCLSYSNFAPLTILLQIGNEMSLDSLAKSVGMDPIVLDNQLQVLYRRDLIDIRCDGMIVAKIPTPE
ncbi:hypothetical protein KAR91_22840, partial [Candidatus Pacearchaeota archaeon]|nr:hypothetical protein [Candidatus Pacearchaeota archaeon]